MATDLPEGLAPARPASWTTSAACTPRVRRAAGSFIINDDPALASAALARRRTLGSLWRAVGHGVAAIPARIRNVMAPVRSVLISAHAELSAYSHGA
jgi:hypothetical protein